MFSNFNFFEQLEPRLIGDLAVHGKKIKEVEDWLKLNVTTKRGNSVNKNTLLIY